MENLKHYKTNYEKDSWHVLHTNSFNCILDMTLWILNSMASNTIANSFFFIPPTKCTKLNNLQQSAIVLHLEELNRLNTIESQKQNIQTIFSVQIITNGRFGGEKQTSVELKYLFQFRKYMKNVCVWLVTRLTVRKFDFLVWNHFKRFGEQQELFNWNCQ